MIRLLLSVSTALMLIAGTVWAGPFEDVTAAYKRDDYATALKIIQPLAAQGNAEAQFNLGSLYYIGRGVPQNFAIARL